MKTENKPDDSPITRLPGFYGALSNIVPTAYRDLPVIVQVAIAHYMAVVGEAWGQGEPHKIWREWSYGGADPGNISDTRAAAAVTSVRAFLKHFRETYGHWEFCYAEVNTFDLCVEVMRHADTKDEGLVRRLDIQSILGDVPTSDRYSTPGWPVMLSGSLESGDGSAVLENGAKRLMRYISDNAEVVPCVWFPNKRQSFLRAAQPATIAALSQQVQELTVLLDELRGLPKRMGALETLVHAAIPRS